MTVTLPIAIIGAGPVGLAAAAHVVVRGAVPIVFETGSTVGASVLDWAHVELFTPWRFSIDSAARTLLETSGWSAPDPEARPTGRELVTRYLKPLAALPVLAPHIRLGARVTAVGRQGIDKVRTEGRAARPFLLTIEHADGREEHVLARAVIDASGTWTEPNPAGAAGLPAPGERAAAPVIRYGIPDVLGAERAIYAGRRVAVVGSGHSAINTLLDLAELAQAVPETHAVWVLRKPSPEPAYGGEGADALPARGALGRGLRGLVDAGRIELATGFRVTRVAAGSDGVALIAEDGRVLDVDRIVVATGFRPGLAMLRELRLSLDPWLECPPALGPLIDPNLHSCGTVRPHGAAELAHPEPGFFIVGIKSYGRAPTFLLATGHEQVRSVVAKLLGDDAAAARVELVLPETGVCSAAPPRIAPVAAAGCCGGPAPAPVDACCVADALAKADGDAGCGPGL